MTTESQPEITQEMYTHFDALRNRAFASHIEINVFETALETLFHKSPTAVIAALLDSLYEWDA